MFASSQEEEVCSDTPPLIASQDTVAESMDEPDAQLQEENSNEEEGIPDVKEKMDESIEHETEAEVEDCALKPSQQKSILSYFTAIKADPLKKRKRGQDSDTNGVKVSKSEA